MFATLVICAVASAQTPVFTLPRGYETMGGGYGSGGGVSYPFDRGDFHYMEVHSSIRGTPRPLTSMRVRRGWGVATNTTAVAHTVDLTLSVGEGPISTFGTTFTSNYATAPTQVFAMKSVKMPDWTTLSGLTPDPWTVLITPFSTPFLYSGKNDFVWELVHANSSLAASSRYLSDRSSSYGNSPTQNPREGDRVYYGTGCTATGRTTAMTHRQIMYNAGPTAASNPMRMNVTSTNNPSSQVVQLAIGIPMQVQIPGWCAPVYLNPLAFVSLGTANASGVLPTSSVDLISPAYIPSLVHQSIVTQTFAADPGLPSGIALSNAAAASMPRDPGDYLFRYTYSLTLTSTTGGGPYTAGSVITGWN